MANVAIQAEKPPKWQNEPELFFAMVRAIGTDSTPVTAELGAALEDARFHVAPLQLSKGFREIPLVNSTLIDTEEDRRYQTYMDAGDLLRSATGRADAAAVLGMKQIAKMRQELCSDVRERRGRAYILKSLMHPREVETLSRVYGSQFFVVSVFAPRDVRVRRLSQRIADSWGEPDELQVPVADELVNRDMGIRKQNDTIARAVPPKFALDVGKTFQKADLFISATAPEESARAVRRFVDLIFSHPFHTPTKEELGMCIAYSACARSASMGRRVGAAILTPDGDVVSVGSNEVPRFGGGQYWPGDEPDGRTFVSGYDTSDRIRRQIVADLIRRLYVDRAWAKNHENEADIEAFNRVLDSRTLDETIDAVLASETISNARVLDVIEYLREVHAEMAAITDAAKRGVSIKGCVLYCTTFPCHECARLIVSAGITRVVYIEPYPKSRVAELYEDSIGLADRLTHLGDRVKFEPFVGISPRRYFDFFSWVPRKASDAPGGRQDLSGRVTNWAIGTAGLRDTVADVESLRSGARFKAISCGEEENILAFEDRLTVAQAALSRTEDGSSGSK